MKDDYFKNLVSTLTRLSNYLGDKPWFTGSKVNTITVQPRAYRLGGTWVY